MKTGALILSLVLAISAAVVTHHLISRRHVPLYAESVAVHADGSIGEVQPGAALLPSSRVFDDGLPATKRLKEQRLWLSRGTVPRIAALGPSSMATDALLDLKVLTLEPGVTVAGWTPAWRYVWPRDAALVASAFARTGHLAEAVRLLDFLQRVQPADGRFQARYRVDGTVPDARGIQLDGTGWALWAVNQVRLQLEAPQQLAFVRRYRRLLDTSSRSAEQLVAKSGLPPPSADYWEGNKSQVTLSTCALLVAGLKAAGSLYEVVGEGQPRDQALAAAATLESATITAFGADGFPRLIGGGESDVDLGVAFLSPPFGNIRTPATLRAWGTAPDHLRRPAGGLAPGGSWKNDGISWTPTVAVWAVTAACLDPPQAVSWLEWLDVHRTPVGSLSEKVLADGSPAAVAPLAISAAGVLITLDELQHGCDG